MTWRNWMWRGSFFAWFLVMVAPLLVLLIPINFVDDQSSTDRLIGNAVMIGAFLILVPLYNWISIKPGKVRLGFFPLYWRTLDISEIRYAIEVEFNPMQDFAGWGIKGLAKSRNGILLGGNPPHGIMLETHDHRRYVLSFPNTGPILNALQIHGVTVTDTPLIDDEETGE